MDIKYLRMKSSIKVIAFWMVGLMILTSACRKKVVTEKENTKAIWITEAFNSLQTSAYPRIKAISWWDENFDQSLLKVNSSVESLEAYQQGVGASLFISDLIFADDLLVENESKIYHSAFPDFGGTEDVVLSSRIADFENAVGKEIAWAYFSDNWDDNISFPDAAVNTIQDAGKVPFIRMMPRSSFDEGGPDPVYSMAGIIDGDFDASLVQWAQDAAQYANPLLVEFGTEVNGSWFPWNGLYNGSDDTSYGDPLIPDGPERFRDAYRHIIDLCDAAGADNITWFFHVDAYSEPDQSWNDMENYYPGDSYIDWLGVSIYGPQVAEAEYQSFSDILNDVYPNLVSLADKPIAILEFAITELD